MKAPAFRVPATASEAVRIQMRLRDRVVARGTVTPTLVAGVDVGYKNGIARAAAVMMRGPDCIEQVVVEEPIRFPYIPGLLSFREIPALLSAWRKLKTAPDAVIVDGQGLAHPRRFGVASHFGTLIGLPTIGCAKSRLCGEYEEPEAERGAWSPLTDRGETLGAALRTRTGTNVVYVSVGHRISLESAISVVLACAARYRLPEPQRFADRLTKS